MAYQDVVKLTKQFTVDEAYDNVKKENTLLTLIEGGKLKAENTGGGSRVDVPLVVRKHSAITMLDAEDTQIKIVGQNVSETASWQFQAGTAPILLGVAEKNRNSGQNAIDNILKVRSETTVQAIAQNINSRILGNSSEHTDFNKIMTFNGLTGGTGAAALTAGTGMFASAAFGSQTHSVGGVSTALYPDAWQHQYATLDASFSVNGLDRISLLIQQCKKASGRFPGVGIFSQLAYQHLRKAIRADFGPLAVDTKLDAMFGFQTLHYDGIPILFDGELQNSGGSTTGLLSAVFLDLEVLKVYHSPDSWFAISEEVSGLSNGFAGDVSSVLVDMAFITQGLKGHAVVVNGETWA